MYNTRAFVLLLIPVCVSMLWHLLLRSKNVEYHQQKVFVAVLSARDHFEHRQAIRSTWASGNFLPNKTTVRFILGTNSCSIPKSYRQSSFNCQPLLSGDRLKQTDGEQILNSQRLVGNLLPSPKINRRSIYRGFAFLTLFDIQLHSVGILECAFQNRKELKNINIQLKDAIAQVIKITIQNSRSNLNILCSTLTEIDCLYWCKSFFTRPRRPFTFWNKSNVADSSRNHCWNYCGWTGHEQCLPRFSDYSRSSSVNQISQGKSIVTWWLYNNGCQFQLLFSSSGFGSRFY